MTTSYGEDFHSLLLSFIHITGRAISRWNSSIMKIDVHLRRVYHVVVLLPLLGAFLLITLIVGAGGTLPSVER